MKRCRKKYRIWGAVALIAAAVWTSGCGEGKPKGPRYEARDALEAGEPHRAREILKEVIDADPASEAQAPVYCEYGVAAWQLRDVDTAVIAFENSRRLDPTLPGPAYNLGVIMKDQGKVFRATALFHEAAQLDPADSRPLEQEAAIEMEAGRWTEAEALLEQALARDPGSARIRTALGVARLRTRGPAEAMTNLLGALDVDDDYGPAYFNLAMVHRDWLGDPETGVRYMESYLKRAGNDERAADALDFIDLKRLGETPGIEPGPSDNVPSGIQLPEPVLIDESDLGGGDGEEPDFVPMVPEFPEPETTAEVAVVEVDPPALVEVAPSLEREPETEVTETVVRRPEPRPRTVEGLLSLARKQAGKGNTVEAYRTCREARAMALRAGDRAAADRILPLAVQLCRDQAGSHYDYGLYLMNAGESAQALQSFTRAVALAPQWVPAYLGMAETAVRTGQNDAAFVALQRALRMEPNHREAMWGMATLYDRGLRDSAKAIEAYEAFLSHHGGDARSREARARIVALKQQVSPRPEPVNPGSPRELTVIRPETTVPSPPATEPKLKINRPRVRNQKAAVEAFNRGTIYQAREDWEQAVFFYTRALEQDDTFGLAYYNLGKVYQSQNQNDIAIEAYEASIRLQPSHMDSRFNLALLYRELGQREKAIDQLKAIQQLDPGHARAHYLLGLMYSGDRRTQAEAVRYFQQFLRLSPNNKAAPAVRQWLADVQ